MGNGGMRLLAERLKKLPDFIERYDAGYGGFRAMIVIQGTQLGFARIEFTRETLEDEDTHCEVDQDIDLYCFKGDAARISEVSFEVSDAGLGLHLPNGATAFARSPQARSNICDSAYSRAKFGIPWRTHSIEVWTPPKALPTRPSESAMERIESELGMAAAQHWGNCLILLPQFAARLIEDQKLGWKVEASIEYDSSLILETNLVLVREIREGRSLWDQTSDQIATLPHSAAGADEAIVKIHDVATGCRLLRSIGAIRGDGGTHYVMTLATESGEVLDTRALPLISEVRFGLQVHDDTAIRNGSMMSHELFAVDPNAPWKARAPRDHFISRPGVWLTQADSEVVKEILDVMASRVIERALVVDPYADVSLLTDFISVLPTNTSIRLICSRVNDEQAFGRNLAKLRKSGYSIAVLRIHISNRPTKTPLHDRYVLTRDAGWYLGTSFNSLASNVSLVAELTPADAARLERQFEEWWDGEVLGKGGAPCEKEVL